MMQRVSAVAPAPTTRPSLWWIRSRKKSVLTLTSNARLTLWLLVVFLELSSAALLTMWAGLYFTHRTRGTLLWVIKVYFLFHDAFEFLENFGFYIASGYVAIASVFLYRVVRLLCVSIRHQELRFGLSTTQLVTSSDNRTASSFRKASLKVVHGINKLQYLFSVHGPYFDIRMLFDEMLELVFQTFAAHASSRSISNEALNQMYGVVILLNSLSFIVFQHVFRSSNNLIKHRVARLLTDLVLDFVWGALLPLWMFQPILKTYLSQLDHGIAVGFTENSAREVERVLVLSWWNYVISVVPFCTTLLNLAEVRSLLREEYHRPSQPKAQMTLVATAPRRSACSHRLIHFIHALVSCVGFVIFLTSLAASDLFNGHHHEALYGCMHRVYPWFIIKEACVGRTVDCSVLGINGSHDELDVALQTLDASTLADLFISNCRALNLSVPSLHRFRHLQSLVLMNSTIVDWDARVAGLSSHAMPDLRTVKLESITFGTPFDTIALFTMPLSHTVEWIYIFNTNMSEPLLREDFVAENWQHLIFMDCASCSLPVFPLRSVGSMHQLIMLSLIDNDIREFPRDWPSPDMGLVMFWIDNNAHLTSLSDAMWHQASGIFQSLYLQNTSIATVPTWLDDAAEHNPVFQVYAFGSPICEPENNASRPRVISCESQSL